MPWYGPNGGVSTQFYPTPAPTAEVLVSDGSLLILLVLTLVVRIKCMLDPRRGLASRHALVLPAPCTTAFTCAELTNLLGCPNIQGFMGALTYCIHRTSQSHLCECEGADEEDEQTKEPAKTWSTDWGEEAKAAPKAKKSSGYSALKILRSAIRRSHSRDRWKSKDEEQKEEEEDDDDDDEPSALEKPSIAEHRSHRTLRDLRSFLASMRLQHLAPPLAALGYRTPEEVVDDFQNHNGHLLACLKELGVGLKELERFARVCEHFTGDESGLWGTAPPTVDGNQFELRLRGENAVVPVADGKRGRAAMAEMDRAKLTAAARLKSEASQDMPADDDDDDNDRDAGGTGAAVELRRNPRLVALWRELQVALVAARIYICTR